MFKTIEEVKDLLSKMKPHFKSGFTLDEQRILEQLNELLFNKGITNTGCQDCYRDAFILISNKVKNMTEMPKPSLYRLKAGVVASSFGSSDFYVLDMPEEAAEKWLHELPGRINQFQRYPEDWQERVDARFSPKAENAPESTNDNQDNEDTDTTASKPRRGRKSANYGI